jgi:CspA family cold shock protein
MATICNSRQPFYQYLLDWDQFIKNNKTTDWCEENTEELVSSDVNDGFEIVKKKIRTKKNKTSNLYRGKLYKWIDSRGFGFIMPDKETQRDRSVWVHISECNTKPIQGSKVTFELVKGKKGVTAKNVQII